MISLKIDNRIVEVEEGASLLDAAQKLDIDIPTMCHLKGYSNHPSCMICVVKDLDTGNLQPSCAFPAQEGMNISTNDLEVRAARKDNLELLLSDHIGDCEAPCRVACPAFMDIPVMNRLIAEGKPAEALQVVKEEIALPIVLGYVCHKPCEGTCRRKPIDGTVEICQLKKYVALVDADLPTPYLPKKLEPSNKTIAIVGAGVAGLTAAFHLAKLGHSVTIYEREAEAGGSLRTKKTGAQLPVAALDQEIKIIESFGIKICCNSAVQKNELEALRKENDAVLIATGVLSQEWAKTIGIEINAKTKGIKADKETFATSLENVFVAGSALREQKHAIHVLAQGKLAAYKLHEYLKNEKIEIRRKYFNSKFGKLNASEYPVYLVESTDRKPVVPENLLAGFDYQQAKQEAERCMHCDCRKVTNCKLRDYSHEYSADQKNYKTSERLLIEKQFAHELIVYESEKCIRCGLCVDITEKNGEELGFSYVARGFDVRIGMAFGESIKDSLGEIALKCAEACPTGAIARK